MSLKRRSKINASFSMASMTDIIFLLLIFFMISSTLVMPNAIKVNLPQAQKQMSAKQQTRLTIDKNLNYYVASGNQREVKISFDKITSFLEENREKEPEMYVALYVDEEVPYREVVKVMSIANDNKFKIALVTKPKK